MFEGKEQRNMNEEKRSYFRVDDIISVVVNPVYSVSELSDEDLKSVMSSKAFPLRDTPEQFESDYGKDPSNGQEDRRLYGMLTEIKMKLDFIINHFMLDKEGLLKPEKKAVNISASGIRFTVEHQVKVKDIMEIKLLLPTYPPVVVFAYGEVKRVEPVDGKYDIALEYLNMGDSVRNEIIQYTLSRQRDTIKRMKEESLNE